MQIEGPSRIFFTGKYTVNEAKKIPQKYIYSTYSFKSIFANISKIMRSLITEIDFD